MWHNQSQFCAIWGVGFRVVCSAGMVLTLIWLVGQQCCGLFGASSVACGGAGKRSPIGDAIRQLEHGIAGLGTSACALKVLLRNLCEQTPSSQEPLVQVLMIVVSMTWVSRGCTCL